MTSIDFNALMEEAGEGFQPIPPGPYTVEVAKAEAVTSSTQKPMIRAQLRILGGPHNGRIVFDQYTVSAGSPRALGFFFDTMAAFGLDRQYFAANPPMEQVAQILLGRSCNVTVAMKQYQGIDRNEVKNYRPISGGQAPAAAPVQGVPQMGGAAPIAQGIPQVPQQPQPQPQPVPQQPQPQPQPVPQQPQPQPVPPQQQPVGQPMWQPSGPPPDANQPQAYAPDTQTYGEQTPQPPQPPQPVAPPPGVVPPMPQVPGPEQRSI
jgi:hypothetical protein